METGVTTPVFVAVAENSKFHPGRRQSCILAQPSLTRQIHNLEEEIGRPVLLSRLKKSRGVNRGKGGLFSWWMPGANCGPGRPESILGGATPEPRGETGQLN